MPHVLLAGPIHEQAMAVLTARPDLTCEVLADPGEAELIARLPEADALLIRTAPLPVEAVARAPRLRVVSRHGVGYDNIPVDALNARGVPLAIIGNVNALAVAEHAVFLMLAVAKQCVVYDRAVRNGNWGLRNSIASLELAAKTLLLLGFGRIGREVARRAQAFDMKVLAYDPFVGAEAVRAAGAEKVEDWRGVLAEVDFISVHLPRIPETENMIGPTELAAMKSTAIIVNTARGGLIDEAALYRALKTGQIRGAGLDTLDVEPPPADHPLLTLDNVILSPHSGALTEECMARMGISAAENVLAGLDGRLNPQLVVNKEVLSRA